MTSTISIVFWGHACFGIHRGDQPILLIDPFDPSGLGTIQGPTRMDVPYPRVIATHAHSDHAAFHTQPHATRIHAPFTNDTLGMQIHAQRVAHDEFGGRLRGGTTQVLDIRIGGRRIVHMGDIGERLLPAQLDWLTSTPIDCLMVPAGGYFTLGADGASALAAAVQPRHVIFCHTTDDGLALPQMADRTVIKRRVAHWPQQLSDALPLSTAPHLEERANEAKSYPTVVWLTRPDGQPFHSSEQR